MKCTIIKMPGYEDFVPIEIEATVKDIIKIIRLLTETETEEKSLASRLKRFQEKYRLTVIEVSRRTNLNRRTVQKVRLGHRVSPRTMQKIEALMNERKNPDALACCRW
jgi:uncharacterized protein YqiB (DUF1249 family)